MAIPYTAAHLKACSPKRPMHPSIYLKSLFEIDAALQSIRAGDEPKFSHWVNLASMVNIMDALRQRKSITDDGGLITDAVNAMAESRIRADQGKAIRLDGKGLQAVNALMLDYTTCCEQLSERTIKSAINYAFERQTQMKSQEKKAKP